MIIKDELSRHELGDHEFDFHDEELNQEFNLYDLELNGTPSPIAIENFAAINYLSAILNLYIRSFHYTKEGFLASYYYNGEFNSTFIITKTLEALDYFLLEI